MTPTEWLEDVEGDIRYFREKAQTWMKVAIIANLKQSFSLSEEEARGVLDQYLESKKNLDSRPMCCVCYQRKASIDIGKKFYCGTCAKERGL